MDEARALVKTTIFGLDGGCVMNIEKQIARFWGKVDIRGPNDCWNWKRALMTNGYGLVRFEGNLRGVHRVAYELTFGKIPDGFNCCHTCDNRLCCNPNHLFIGTQKDNIQDCVRKERLNTAKGEKKRNHKLTKEDVLMIRSKYALGYCSHGDLAKEFNIARSGVTNIINGKRWKHVKEDDF